MALLISAAVLVAPTNPLVPSNAFDTILLPNTVGIHPEPRDMFVFVATLLFIPLTLTGIVIAGLRLDETFESACSIFWAIVLASIIILVAGGFLLEIRSAAIFWYLVVALICLVLAKQALSLMPSTLEKVLNRGLLGLLLISVALVLTQRVWTASSLVYYGPISSHYEAVTSSVVRIASGGTCLVDVITQYGCYGEFVAPFLKIAGSSVTAVTVLFSALLIAAIGAAMRFSTKIITHPLLILGCCLCIVITAALNLVYYVNDPVLQYFPLRFLFPSISLLMAAWFQNHPNKARAALSGLFAGAAITWNLESGIAVFISLGAFVTIGNFTARPWLEQERRFEAMFNAAAYLLGAVVFVSAFVAFLSVKSGRPVDLQNYIIYQKVFSVTGFGMIPLPPPPSLWMIHGLLIFGTLVFCALRACSHKQRDKGLELAAYVAILGIGLCAYYVGRSHPLVLRLIAWPSIFLFFFLLDRTVEASPRNNAAVFAKSAIVASIALPAAFLIAAVPSVARVAFYARNASPKDNRAILEDIQFIKSRTVPDEPVAIIAIDQGVLYGHTRTAAAIEGPSVAEMIRQIDLRHQMESLVGRGPQKLFLGTNLNTAAEQGLLGTSISIDMDTLGKAYEVEETAPGGRLIYLRRKRGSIENHHMAF